MVKDVYVSEDGSNVLLTLEHDDQSKYSIFLKHAENNFSLSEKVINVINRMLELWNRKRGTIAQKYVEDRRNESAFLYDAVGKMDYWPVRAYIFALTRTYSFATLLLRLRAEEVR